jgi:hypothetical protein
MEKDLLPWILGAALIAAGALAATVEFTQHAPTVAVNAPLAAPPGVTPAPTAAPPPAAPSTFAAPAAAAPASLPATVFPAPDAGTTGMPTTGPASADASANGGRLPPGEIWQCIVNGQKIFSDKRCGNGASVRQIGDVNVMEAPAPAPYGMYRPGQRDAGPPYPAGPSYPDDQDDTGLDSDGYVGQQIIVARERERREHHHQDTHPHAAANRGAPGPHNPR